MKPEMRPVIGEDGELIKPDAAVNPDDYAQYVATHARRDPLSFRIREHVSYYGCAYLCLLPVIFLVGLAAINGAWCLPVLVLVPLALFAAMANSPKNSGT